MIRAILLWVAVTAVFYGAAYFAWTFSPLISVGLALGAWLLARSIHRSSTKREKRKPS